MTRLNIITRASPRFIQGQKENNDGPKGISCRPDLPFILTNIPSSTLRNIFLSDKTSYCNLFITAELAATLKDAYFIEHLGYSSREAVDRHRSFDIKIPSDLYPRPDRQIFLIELANGYINGHITREAAVDFINYLTGAADPHLPPLSYTGIIPKVARHQLNAWLWLGMLTKLIEGDDFLSIAPFSFGRDLIEKHCMADSAICGKREFAISAADHARVGIYSAQLDKKLIKSMTYSSRVHYLIKCSAARRAGKQMGPLGPYTTNEKLKIECQRLFMDNDAQHFTNPSTTTEARDPEAGRSKDKRERNRVCAII